MATSDTGADQAWGMLVDVGEEERKAKMLQRYGELANLSEEERRSQMLAMAGSEYDLPADKLRTFTIFRLQVWLQLEPEVAQRISASYDAAMQKMPGLQAMRRVALVQTLAREFSSQDQERLVALMPNVFGGLKEVISPHRAEEAQPAPAKKGWWPFRKR